MTPALGAGPAGSLSQVAGGFFSGTFAPPRASCQGCRGPRYDAVTAWHRSGSSMTGGGAQPRARAIIAP
jgi:hypothetical protein